MRFRVETDSLGKVKVPHDRLWGAQTQRSLEHFSIGNERMPHEMVRALAIVKKACAIVNCKQNMLSKEALKLITRAVDEILEGRHDDHFPLHVWMTGSGTQFNMNLNEVIGNLCSKMAKKPLGSKKPVHPNDHVNMSQSTNDAFPAAMHVAAVIEIHERLLPNVRRLARSLHAKAKNWQKIVKLGRTHLQDATPVTLGQEFSGYAAMVDDAVRDIEHSIKGLYPLTLGGTAVGTGLNTKPGFDRLVAQEIALLTKLPFVTAPNKFAAQGAHDAMGAVSSSLKRLAGALFKISNDIRLLASGPRAGLCELVIPSNEPGSSMMPGKENPTQCEAMSMLAIQVMANDLAVTLGTSGGHLEMNVYKPLIIHNVLQSIRMLADGSTNFDRYLVRGIKPHLKQLENHLEQSLMLVTALSPKIGYDKAAEIAEYALSHHATLKSAALKLGYVTEAEYDEMINPLHMCRPDL
ncbi:MAG: hypothetical protein RL235_311 [Chlamydiota bacterium]|jgi:fumarate hydratase class II